MSRSYQEEARKLADQAAEATTQADRAQETQPAGGMILVGHTVSEGAYPTAGKFFAVDIDQIMGDEYEGADAVSAPGSRRIYAAHLGASAPPVNTTVIIYSVPHRYILFYP